MVTFSDFFSDVEEAVFSCLGQISMLTIFMRIKFDQLCISFSAFLILKKFPHCTEHYLFHKELAKWLFLGNYELSWILTLQNYLFKMIGTSHTWLCKLKLVKII